MAGCSSPPPRSSLIAPSHVDGPSPWENVEWPGLFDHGRPGKTPDPVLILCHVSAHALLDVSGDRRPRAHVRTAAVWGRRGAPGRFTRADCAAQALGGAISWDRGI